jgi:hypothetical protein
LAKLENVNTGLSTIYIVGPFEGYIGGEPLRKLYIILARCGVSRDFAVEFIMSI